MQSRLKEVVLGSAADSPIFGGFAPKSVAGILPSKDKSMARRTPNLQEFLRKFGCQIPGERSALITDDQAIETKFARVLLSSVLNGFAGLDDVPMENILRYLNRFVVNNLVLDLLKQFPGYASRTLAENIFRAAIEFTDTKVVKLLLSRKLVDVNDTVCLHEKERYTQIERAAALRSLKLMRALIDSGADVNKSYASFRRETERGAAAELMSGIEDCIMLDKQSKVPPESFEAFNILVAAGAQVDLGLMVRDRFSRTVEIDFLVMQNVDPERHRNFFLVEPGTRPEFHALRHIATHFNDCRATQSIRNVINLCHQNNCNNCLANFGDQIRHAVVDAASNGKVEFVQLLLDKADLRAELPRIFIAAIQSRSHALIDFILSLGPELDPLVVFDEGHDPWRPMTPIAEAVKHGNEYLIQKLEAGGCLDHLHEGDRFGAVISAAAEAGNAHYMKTLLARAVTSKSAYREAGTALTFAVRGRHHDIVQMLLEAGATSHTTRAADSYDYWKSVEQAFSREDVELAQSLIASGVDMAELMRAFGDVADQYIIPVLAHEYPKHGLMNHPPVLRKFLRICIKTDTPELFKELFQIWAPRQVALEDCLETTVELGHSDLTEYLLDMGASPFSTKVLRFVVPDQPDMLRLLFQTERRRQNTPIMSHGAGNAEALDELIRTKATSILRD